jgi:hypothetical protein
LAVGSQRKRKNNEQQGNDSLHGQSPSWLLQSVRHFLYMKAVHGGKTKKGGKGVRTGPDTFVLAVGLESLTYACVAKPRAVTAIPPRISPGRAAPCLEEKKGASAANQRQPLSRSE